MDKFEIGDFPKHSYPAQGTSYPDGWTKTDTVYVLSSSLDEGLQKFREFLIELIEVPAAQRLMRKYGIFVTRQAQRELEEKGEE